ncbi:sigma-70 family RNA polymerase sigma factor [Planococcus kocurii]|uniref:RNA polymerase subunit sigma-24 n=1 Tax=Planococcus kocurii TaxID=1374 RepID=A0ABN4JSV4_9BACL|nr:sigma-70 family RNA polymerase sigma factor [Planococcus kocurii]ALS77968.1 RNA polymerase subunit sigma-24 [Planococcus kocurii]
MKNFEEVAVQYAPMISAMIRKLHIHRDYDTFRQLGNIALWQAWQRFEEGKGHFTPFAYRSIRGAMLDELKRETKRTNQLSLLESILIEEGIEEEMETLPEWLILNKLDAKEKWLLEALFVRGYSLSYLADQQGISLAGMKKRRERLLKKVRDAIDHPFKT